MQKAGGANLCAAKHRAHQPCFLYSPASVNCPNFLNQVRVGYFFSDLCEPLAREFFGGVKSHKSGSGDTGTVAMANNYWWW